MNVEKLFKRYLKEIGVYATAEAKMSIAFMKEFSEHSYPFNSFRWDTSEQGDLYWFERAVNWLVFLYNNYDNIDEGLLTKKAIAHEIRNLFWDYTPTDAPKLDTFAFYNDVSKILTENNIEVDFYQ